MFSYQQSVGLSIFQSLCAPSSQKQCHRLGCVYVALIHCHCRSLCEWVLGLLGSRVSIDSVAELVRIPLLVSSLQSPTAPSAVAAPRLAPLEFRRWTADSVRGVDVAGLGCGHWWAVCMHKSVWAAGPCQPSVSGHFQALSYSSSQLCQSICVYGLTADRNLLIFF